MASVNKTARNERRKITANAVNTVAVSLIVSGLVVPAATLTYQSAYPHAKFWWVFALAWFMVGIMLHLLARRLLEDIEE